MLAARYAVRAGHIEPVTEGTETLNARVHLATGGQIFVKRYRDDSDTTAILAALAFAAYCGESGIPTPALWLDTDGEHLTRYGDAAWCVTDQAPGRPASTPLTTGQGEVIGGALGRLHRVTADYRGPLRQASSTWRDGDPASATARCEALLESLHTTPGPLAERRRGQLSKRLNDLLIWPRRLRGGLPPALSQQALHGDATRPNLLWDGDTVTLVDFRAVSGPVVWELAKIAFDPLTVAHSDTWSEVAAAVIGAYRQENPGVRPAELAATARVALLYRMFSTFGAVSDDPLAPPEAAAVLARSWDDTHETIARLQQRLGEVEELLQAQAAATPKAVTR